ncbi:MAG: hypothetical protein JWQ87_31 [Candidatus Sulfotelmatobacter sp.]|nr:hypothetical protein [Candidatus Sulfotelmatobacter sp.]
MSHNSSGTLKSGQMVMMLWKRWLSRAPGETKPKMASNIPIMWRNTNFFVFFLSGAV